MSRPGGILPSVPARTRRRGYHHGDLRRALLEASLQIIQEEGVSRLTLRDAARRVGVSHAAPQHHFGDLWGLHCAIAEEGYRKLHAHMAAARDEEAAATPLQAFKRVGVAYADFAARNPGHFRAMFHPAVSDRKLPPSLEQAAEAAFALLLDCVRAAQAAGEIRAGEPRELALFVWSAVHGLACLAVDRQLRRKGFSSEDPAALAEGITDQLYQGLRP